MTVGANGPSSASIDNEGGFHELGIRLEDTGFCARGLVHEDRIRGLESAGMKLGGRG